MDQLGERVALELGEQVQPRRTRQVVEPVTELEVLHLLLEHVVERGAEQATEDHPLLGEPTDPQVDVVDARGGGRPAHERRTVGGGLRVGSIVGDDASGRCPLGRERRGRVDRRVPTVGCDEVDQRVGVLEAQTEVRPARVRRQRRVGRRRVEGATRRVQRGNSGLPSSAHVDRGQVERQAEQVVAQCLGDELVDLVAGLAGHPSDDAARSLLGRESPVLGVRDRVQERVDERHGRGSRRARSRDPADLFGQHGVPEAVDGVCELGADPGVELGVVAAATLTEEVDHRLHLAGELLEREVLVLHLGHELGGLEDPLAVPLPTRLPLAHAVRVFSGQHVLDAADDALVRCETVVLGVEHVVHGDQADVLVDPAVTGDEVGVEHLVVVRRRDPVVDGSRVIVRSRRDPWRGGIVVVVDRRRVRVVRDVIEERVSGPGRVCRDVDAEQPVAVGVDERVSLDQTGGGDDLRVAVLTRQELAVGVGGEQRDVQHVGVGQANTEEGRGLVLRGLPGGQASVGAGEHQSGAHGLRGSTGGRSGVLAQEDLVRGVGGVGLALVDQRRGLVGGLPGATGRPGDHHEALVRRGGRPQRVVLLQRDEHRASAALVDQVEAVVEELAEEGEPRVVRRGQADVGGDVLDEQGPGLVGSSALTGGSHGRGVAQSLVDDQVAHGARPGVDHVARERVVAASGAPVAREPGRSHVGLVVLRGHQTRELVVGRAEPLLARDQVVAGAVDGAQAPRQELALRTGGNLQRSVPTQRRARVGHRARPGVFLGDLDLLEDEPQVGRVHVEPLTDRGDGR